MAIDVRGLGRNNPYKLWKDIGRHGCESLNILLLGVGAIGRTIATHLSKSVEVSGLTLGDIYVDKAKELADGLGSGKVSALKVDAGSYKALLKVLKGIDVVINATSPKYNLTIMKAALESQAHYIDLASDIDLKEQLVLNDSWKERGLTAILGLGEDPGLSNIFARHAAEKLDKVERIRIRDGETAVSRDFAFPILFSPEVFLEEALLEEPIIYRNGSFRKLEPFAGKEIYRFPDPIGPLAVYNVSHEEVKSLPLFMNKSVKYVDFKLAFSPEIIHMLKTVKMLGLMNREPMEVKGLRITPRDVLLALFPRPEELAGNIDGYACILVDVEGKKAGKKRRHLIYTAMSHQEAYEKYGVTATSYLTGTPPAIGAVLLGQGEIRSPGVISPECLDPELFWTTLAQRGITIREMTM